MSVNLLTPGQGRAALGFLSGSAAAALVCGVSGHLDALAPLMASAAVLAITPPKRAALVATIKVYLFCLILGALGHALLPVNGLSCVLLCLAGLLLCLRAGLSHPPALAMLALVMLKGPDPLTLLWLAIACLALCLGAALANTLCNLLESIPTRLPDSYW